MLSRWWRRTVLTNKEVSVKIVMIDLSPTIEQQLRDDAARHGRDAAEWARTLVERQLTSSHQERSQRIAALLERWNAEDRADPDPNPLLEITPLSLREVSID